ncbi:hypothetical protein DFH07DRAFT_771349 [Mycena maculata]|uniref:Uncharacterized protein n=1 Tax=Mycena maculata TaxID=230809 RepID=A0AAD7JCM1_9AGAR|nr:hypothetical protein DFH07DRAFT_771349 [Mycena maculata]
MSALSRMSRMLWNASTAINLRLLLIDHCLELPMSHEDGQLAAKRRLEAFIASRTVINGMRRIVDLQIRRRFLIHQTKLATGLREHDRLSSKLRNVEREISELRARLSLSTDGRASLVSGAEANIASARKWPRLRSHKHNQENERRDEIRIREEKAGKAERVARAARLMALRSAGNGLKISQDARFISLPLARRLLLDMEPIPPRLPHDVQSATPRLPIDMHWEIIQHCDLSTLLSLTRLDNSFDVLVRPFIYREIVVSRRAKMLIKTLVFENTRANVRLPEREWNRVLLRMQNLKHLVVTNQVPLSREAISRLPFRLIFFGACCTVAGAWADLVASQTSLEVLCFEDEFFSKLPTLKARPADVAHFMESHSGLLDVWLWSGSPNSGQAGLTSPEIDRLTRSPSRPLTMRLGAGQLLILLDEAPALLSAVVHIAIDEDDDWWSFGFLLTPLAAPKTLLTAGQTPNRLLLLAAGLDTRFPTLKTLMFVPEMNPINTGFNQGSRLIADIGFIFSCALRPLCTAPHLRTFHFCAYDGCVTLKNWGQLDEEFHVAEWEEHSENESSRSAWFPPKHDGVKATNIPSRWIRSGQGSAKIPGFAGERRLPPGLHFVQLPRPPPPIFAARLVAQRFARTAAVKKKKRSLRRAPPRPAQPIPISRRVRRCPPPEDGLEEMKKYFEDPAHEDYWQAGVAALERSIASGREDIPGDESDFAFGVGGDGNVSATDGSATEETTAEIHTNGWRGQVVVVKSCGEHADNVWGGLRGEALSPEQVAELWEPTAMQAAETKYRVWLDEHFGKGKRRAVASRASSTSLTPPPSTATFSGVVTYLARRIGVSDSRAHKILPGPSNAEDKALKLEVIRNGGRADSLLLSSWLYHYGGPSTPPAPHGPDFHERKRAELIARVVARKARVNALLNLRRHALEASARKWPHPRSHKHNQENERRDEIRIREEKAGKAERVARAARVAHLMALRSAGNGRKNI